MSISRRQFLKGLTMTGSAVALGGPGFVSRLWAEPHLRPMHLSAFLPSREAVIPVLDAALCGPVSRLVGGVLVVEADRYPELESVVGHLQQRGLEIVHSPREISRHSDLESDGRAYRLQYQLADLSKPVPADLTISVGRRSLLDPRKAADADLQGLHDLARSWRERNAVGRHFLSFELRRQVPGGAGENSHGRLQVSIESQGREQHRLWLGGSRRDLEVPGRLGSAIVRVDRGVQIVKAPCRNRICQNMGPAVRAGESLVCAPNGLLIHIIGDGDVDSVVW